MNIDIKMNGASPIKLNQRTNVGYIILVVFFIISIKTIKGFSQTVNFTSSNLPIIKINTNGQTIPNEPKIMADMGIIYKGVGVRNNVLDANNHYNGKVGIEVRGQSSQQFPMKSYSIELWNASGASINQSLLGMPSESDWVLYAPYTDKTLMRNALAYQISRELGNWAANCKHVEVMLNGEYIGVYILMEKIKRKVTRVNVASLNATDINYPTVSGGYIFSLDKEPNGWVSNFKPLGNANSTIRYSYVYPKETNIVNEQKQYLKNYVDSFENALNANNGTYKNFCNLNTFVDYMLVNEVSRNVDGYRLSAYFNKDRLGKINAGPVWDYDLAFRNANYCSGSNTTGWAYKFDEVCPQDFFAMPFWWKALMKDTTYKSALRCRFLSKRKNVISTNRLNTFVDSVALVLQEAQQRHFTKWPILGQYIWPNPQPIPSSYAEEISTLKNWLQQRLTWLDDNMPNEGACFTFPANESKDIIVKLLQNPIQGKINLNIQSKKQTSLQIVLFDNSGRQILTKNIAVNDGDQYNYTAVKSLANTIHFLMVFENGKVIERFKVR